MIINQIEFQKSDEEIFRYFQRVISREVCPKNQTLKDLIEQKIELHMYEKWRNLYDSFYKENKRLILCTKIRPDYRISGFEGIDRWKPINDIIVFIGDIQISDDLLGSSFL